MVPQIFIDSGLGHGESDTDVRHLKTFYSDISYKNTSLGWYPQSNLTKVSYHLTNSFFLQYPNNKALAKCTWLKCWNQNAQCLHSNLCQEDVSKLKDFQNTLK